MELFEKDKEGNRYALLIFENFEKSNREIKGKWMNSDSSKTYQILLKKDWDIDSGYNLEWPQKELLQSKSTKQHYFKTIITKKKDDFYPRVSGLKIYEKQTDKLIQTIEFDFQLFGMDNIRIGDYNFDGIQDFSIYDASYGGTNTPTIYVLRNPNSDDYIKSNFGPTNNYFKSSSNVASLEFDNDSKLIYELI